jgi:deazaflavin-dependent oxidoreductase (nitroreductase family)
MTRPQNFNQQIIEEFRANEGKVGGPFAGAPMLLLHHKGRKSGEERVNPLVYYQEGDTMHVFGSMGGAPQHPQWYRNLVANPHASVEVGTEQFNVEAREVSGPERDRIYDANAALRPTFKTYQERTTRKIPVIALRRRA